MAVKRDWVLANFEQEGIEVVVGDAVGAFHAVSNDVKVIIDN